MRSADGSEEGEHLISLLRRQLLLEEKPFGFETFPCLHAVEKPVCTPCLSLWEKVAERSEDGEGRSLLSSLKSASRPSQSPAVTALPEGEPRVCACYTAYWHKKRSVSVLIRSADCQRTGSFTSVCFPYAVTMLAALCSLSFSMASSRILYLRILPAAFMGKAGTKSM